jgi:hypothetical protein
VIGTRQVVVATAQLTDSVMNVPCLFLIVIMYNEIGEPPVGGATQEINTFLPEILVVSAVGGSGIFGRLPPLPYKE